ARAAGAGGHFLHEREELDIGDDPKRDMGITWPGQARTADDGRIGKRTVRRRLHLGCMSHRVIFWEGTLPGRRADVHFHLPSRRRTITPSNRAGRSSVLRVTRYLTLVGAVAAPRATRRPKSAMPAGAARNHDHRREPVGSVRKRRPAAVVRSEPDGSNWLMVFDNHAANPFVLSDLPYDTEKDLDPVLLIGTAPYVMCYRRKPKSPSRPRA